MKKRSGLGKRCGHVRNHRLATADAIMALEPRRLMSTTIVVNTFADQTDPSTSTTISLRDALSRAATASGGATVELPGGTYTLTLGQLLVNSTSGTVSVQPVSGTPVISAGGSGGVLQVASGATLSISGVEIENGYISAGPGDDGAGINNAGNLTLTGSTVASNKIAYIGTSGSDNGAGIYNSGTLDVVDSVVMNNTAAELDTENLGGGIYNAGQLIMSESTVSGDKADQGAGIFNSDGAYIQASTISGNGANYEGGGLSNAGTLTMTNTTVANNTAGYDGGGIDSTGSLTVTNSTVTGNTVESEDGATTPQGGGIASMSGTATLGNTIVAGNTASSFGGSPAPIGPDVSAAVTSKGGNLIGIKNGSTGWISTDQAGISAAPLAAELSALGSHGGQVQTEIPQSGSPAVDHGINSLVTGTVDARGLTRIVNGTVDAGAVESQVVVTAPAGQNAKVGAASNISLGSFSDPGGVGPYTVTVNWADGSANTVFSVSGPGSLGTQVHTFASASTFNGTVTITDGYGEGGKATSDPSVVVTTGVTSVVQLTGTVIGTTGSYNNDGNTAAKAFDGNLSTYFDGPTANGNWVGLDLGTAKTITQIKYASRSGFAGRMNGGIFQASNSSNFSTGVVTLYTIASNANPSSTTLTTQAVSAAGTYRYVRYLAPAGSYGNVAEAQFFGPGVALTQRTGTVIGTAGSYNNDGNTAAKAFDGNLSTFFDGPTANGDWVGLDLGSAMSVSQISYAPRSGFTSRMVGGIFQMSTTANFSSGVTNLYTITTAPAAGVLTTVTLSSPVTARYFRYLAPAGGYGNIAEMQLFG